jgi:phosphatidylserine/phosphatidylglycerophosphate/cardiolipin synthase-like enzyme
VIEGFSSLSANELRAIATALRAGRLSAPLSQLALAPYLGRAATAVAPILVTLATQGLSPDHLAFFLDLLASDRESRADIRDAVELVSTGPEAPGYPMRDTRIVVRELFRQAERSVLVAGYAVYQGRDVFEALAERMDQKPELTVRMFLDVQRNHGDTSSTSDILRHFVHRFRTHEWPGSRLPNVYYDPRSLDLEASKRTSLHAKCVVADERIAFISSANFTEAAQVRNLEVGALIRSQAFAQQLANHFVALADRHILQRVPGL